MEGTVLSTLLMVYLGGVIAAWLSPLYLRSAADRQALRQIALLWPALLASLIIVFGAALIRIVRPNSRSAL